MPTFFAVVFGCVLAFAFAALGWVIWTRHLTDRQVVRLQGDLVELRKQSRQLEADREQASQNKDVVMRVLQQCRSADDVPDFGGRRIVANLVNGESVFFYVPPGEHELVVNTSWERTEKQAAKADENSDEEAGETSGEETGEPKVEKGERSWTIQLVSGRGYCFVVTGQTRQETPIGWRLSSNAKQFTELAQELPLPPMRSSMTSWSSFRIAEFPNRFSTRAAFNLSSTSVTDATTRQPIQIGRWTKSGSTDRHTTKIYFDLKIHSQGPQVITATDAETLTIANKTQFLGEYLGDGLYRAIPDGKAIAD